ncbi:MAG: hypothetical protein GY918_04890 [Gammaproteobacteria bacterium]|nr:hypothetical protein [Gammaproteobacteria bacterium]
MAIRGPMMKEPEDATDVFDVTTGTLSNGSTQTTGFPIDMQISRSISNDAAVAIDRLRGTNIRTSASQARGLYTSSTSAENTNNNNSSNWDNTGFDVTGTFGNVNAVWWNFKRAKGFFDAVAYKGNGTAGRTVSHSLGVVPEMIWAKCRSNGGNAYYWQVYHVGTGNTKSLRLNESNATATIPVWNNTTPTDSVFELDNWGNTNGSGETYIAYLFASLDGISKVGSYTGSSSSVVNVDCGFSNGARFVLIKRTDSNGDWMVFDTERGIVTGNDPMLNLNNTDAEWSGGDLLDPYSSGFSVNPNWAGSTDNGTYIFYAIA